MPKVDVNGVGIFYDINGLEDKTPMFFTGHGRKGWMWQITYFSE